jgi:predicted RNA binding protein YcfA (HicA-like mRNA interferase family)
MGISISSRKVISVLKDNGFVFKSSEGSHHKYAKGRKTVIVKHPKKDISIGTLYSIIDQSGLSPEDFKK